ncbi:MAG: ATP-binding cassette domain-containing protein [Ruminococcus sp.]|nr:ATP-binding cassette domain-containing protein [Ruminococcus sp.]
MLDTTGLFATLNAWDNIEFYDRIYHPDSSAAERKARISGVFKEISLDGKEKQYVTKYSKGMKQRLTIGRTMVTKPRFIILDEPYLGLDFEGANFFLQIISLTLDNLAAPFC